MGQEFSKAMDGFFDFIELLTPQDIDDDLEKLPTDAKTADTWKRFAPLVSFNTNEEYLAKWTGAMPPKGIVNRRLHVRKVFEEANAGV